MSNQKIVVSSGAGGLLAEAGALKLSSTSLSTSTFCMIRPWENRAQDFSGEFSCYFYFLDQDSQNCLGVRTGMPRYCFKSNRWESPETIQRARAARAQARILSSSGSRVITALLLGS